MKFNSHISKWLFIKRESLGLFLIFLIAWLTIFRRPLLYGEITGWDTHAAFFNFLYFSDALKEGYVPFRNHFILGGDFFPDLNNSGLFSLFSLLFVGLSWIIPPGVAYELMLQTILLLGFLGSFLLFLKQTKSRYIALFSALMYSPLMMESMVGQNAILISLSSLPWLILISIAIFNGNIKGINKSIFLGILLGLYLTLGYLWMTAVNFVIAFFAASILYKAPFLNSTLPKKNYGLNSIVNWLVFFGGAALAVICFKLPGYWNMLLNYELIPNIVSLDPRLRGLGTAGEYSSLPSNLIALISAIDPRIYLGNDDKYLHLPRWCFGAGWLICLIALLIPAKKYWLISFFWFGVCVLALLYTAGFHNFTEEWAKKIPIFNGNRYWFLGTFYCVIALNFMAASVLKSASDQLSTAKKYGISLTNFANLMFTSSLGFLLLIYMQSPYYEFIFLVIAFVLITSLLLCKNPSQFNGLIVASMICNISFFALLPVTGIGLNYNDANNENIKNRTSSVVIQNNYRKLGQGDTFVFNDPSWVLKKIPFSHGYNPLSNPYYWFVKNDPFLEQLVVITQNVHLEKKIDKQNFASDNEFAKAYMADVVENMARPTIDQTHFQEINSDPAFASEIQSLRIEPNFATIKLQINAPAYLIFNNLNHPDWAVFINDQPADKISANRIFQGVYLNHAGSYSVSFQFRPYKMIALFLLPYLILIISLSIGLWHQVRQFKK